MVGITEFPQLLFKMLNSCIVEPHQFLSVFIMSRDGLARLDFIQNMEYKFVELLTLEYMASSEEQVRQQITYRYNSLKSKMNIMQNRLQDINNLVKLKNPSLLLQMQKAFQKESKK